MENKKSKMEQQLNMENLAGVLDVLEAMGIKDDVQNLMKQKEREKYLAMHREDYPIWQNKKGRWVSYVPDASFPNQRRQISANLLPVLEDKIIAEYKKQNSPHSTLTMRILYPRWLEYRLAMKEVKPQTIIRIKKDWVRYYENNPIVDMPLNGLTSDFLQSWINDMISIHKMGRHQFGNFSLIIRRIFTYAYNEGLISNNPFDRVYVKWSGLHKEERTPDAEQVFKKPEQETYINFCWSKYHKSAQFVQVFVPLAIIFDFYTGLRCCELSAVKFSDISGGLLKVQRMVEYNTREIVPRLKDDEDYRYVPLIPEAVAVLEEVKRKRQEMGLPVNGYVFAIDEPINTYTQIQKLTRGYCKSLNMAPRSPHDIRRTYVSNLIDAKFDILTIMKYAGHKNASTTMGSYAFAVREALENLPQLSAALAV